MEMEPTHRFPLLAVALLLCTWSATAAKTCPPCGLTPVHYPLSTTPGCGDQAYKVRCVSDTLRFDTINSSYVVTSVDAENQKLVIAAADFAGNTCVTTDFPSQGVHLNDSGPFNISSENTIFFLNCSNNLLNSPLNCTAESACHTFINAGGQAAQVGCGKALCCSFKTGGSVTAHWIRIREIGCQAYRSFVGIGINPTPPVSNWKPGLEIQWVAPSVSAAGLKQ